MVHLQALPGAPLFRGSIEAVIEAAIADATALANGGCDGIVFENFGSYTPIWWLSVLFGVLSALINLPIVEKPVVRGAVPAVAQPA